MNVLKKDTRDLYHYYATRLRGDSKSRTWQNEVKDDARHGGSFVGITTLPSNVWERGGLFSVAKDTHPSMARPKI